MTLRSEYKRFESDASFKKVALGSNKNIYSVADTEAVAFEFSDRVSVFDWGPLSADFTGRGAAMERFASAMAKELEAEGVATSYLKTLSEQKGAYCSSWVAHPKFDHQGKSEFVFLPLEVIVRWGVPQGSSLLKKAEYKLWERFESPRIDYTTKLEAIDRPIEGTEVEELVSGSGCKVPELESFTLKAAEIMRAVLEKRGLELWDAKFELAFNKGSGEFQLVDAITPDEMRVTLKGMRKISLSKEMLRLWLRQTPWFLEIQEAKKTGAENWKDSVRLPQPNLGSWRSQKFVGLYNALAELMEDAGSKSLWNWIREEEQVPTAAVIGGGGREEALRWRLREEGVEVLGVDTLDAVEKLGAEKVDTVFVSMDGDLAEGAVDRLAGKEFWTFGPTQKASQVEWSKTFGREIALKAEIPSPLHSTEVEKFSRKDKPPVLKLDGLAAGKGVFVCNTWEELDEELARVKDQGANFYFEEQLAGEEASLFFECFTGPSGKSEARFLGSSKDYKRRYLGDEGPNTGGMGALVPHPSIKLEGVEEIQGWVDRMLQVMEADGHPYRGVLYIGAMKDHKKGWSLIEFNSRFGDPETQALCCGWPEDKSVLRSMLQLQLEQPTHYFEDLLNLNDNSEKVLCLSLVHPDYPGKAEPLSLEDWSFKNSNATQVYRTQSQTGRIAYVVSKAASYLEAGDSVFETLLQSPWKDDVEWRMDILK